MGKNQYAALQKEIMTKLQLGNRSSEILINRGIQSVEAATRYLNPSLADLHDPFLFEDMEKVVERILKAQETHEKICLYGDYDADGTTGVAILLNFLQSNGFNVSFFIPNRLITGYGLHQTPLQTIIDEGITLLITVDNGISANEQIDFCNLNHLDVIVTDHHECHGILPQAYGIINPKVPGSTYPFKDLCGAGVAFKLVQALSQRLQVEMDIQNAIECVALATVADLVSLQDENRSLVSIGLNYLNTNPSNLGIRALMTVSDLTELKAWHFGFVLGPKINAAGRLGEANHIVALLTGSDSVKLMDLAHYLSEENRKRQDLEATILAEALALVENEKLFRDDIIIVVGENWHPGVIGIVASRIQEKYFNPVIVISVENNIGKASCRSVEGFSIFAALSSCSDCFTSFGGHDQAAGFSIKTENIKEMSVRVKAYGESVGIKKYLVKTYSYDAIIDDAEITWELLNECARFEPCGIGNPGVQLVLNHPEIKSMGTMGKENNHLRLMLKNDIRGVGFGLGDFNEKFQELPKSVSNTVKMLCRLDVNDYQGNKTLQVLIKDIKINPIWQIDTAMVLVKTIVQQQNPKAEIDFEAVAINLADLYLDREIVKKVYLLLKKSNDHGVALDAGDKAQISPFHLLMSCEILREVGLIAYRLKEGLIFSKILETKEKKDIQKTKLMIKLVKMISE
ncbi:single-stranded-DNA-specific exonuclease RecJ [Acetobacterium woodii]|uniref:Single-stranded-DNA-specific exonuclease RecJ n=1 Tax=Acetobacterium woodii (strain ATCC 29683 / DSM 1030 / JCM 2381 / KCTC 1655 / WB1) TaxID=931626 RepID=H6LC07_ACEWD|nr:single-stranded-DNA-specific exonuclease RecJ [Acetobacterium woodii]AFA48955.1 single-stranded-DNA-specific exonuclease RecJ [Acetobacterium woodii DSM 1030]